MAYGPDSPPPAAAEAPKKEKATRKRNAKDDAVRARYKIARRLGFYPFRERESPGRQNWAYARKPARQQVGGDQYAPEF